MKLFIDILAYKYYIVACKYVCSPNNEKITILCIDVTITVEWAVTRINVVNSFSIGYRFIFTFFQFIKVNHFTKFDTV